jgi:preprotein translocase subunit SecA
MQFQHPETGSYAADEEAADVLEEQQRLARIAAASGAAAGAAGMAIGRNDPCPCGSGRKYKHCHGQA